MINTIFRFLSYPHHVAPSICCVGLPAQLPRRASAYDVYQAGGIMGRMDPERRRSSFRVPTAVEAEELASKYYQFLTSLVRKILFYLQSKAPDSEIARNCISFSLPSHRSLYDIQCSFHSSGNATRATEKSNPLYQFHISDDSCKLVESTFNKFTHLWTATDDRLTSLLHVQEMQEGGESHNT